MAVDALSFHAFGGQIAGSFPMLKRDDGRICKPATEAELKFYTKTLKHYPEMASFVPKFLGQISISANIVDQASQEEHESKQETKYDCSSLPCKRRLAVENSINTSITSNTLTPWSYKKLVRKMDTKRCKKVVRESDDYVYLVLENLTDKLNYPHIMDIKVGTQQHGSNEPPSKKQSKTRKCLTTTSHSLGLRICGMQTYDVNGNEYRRDKYFGRTLSDESFELAVRNFVSYQQQTASLDKDSDSLISDQNQKIRTEIVVSLVNQLDELISVVKSVNWRFYGCSALITFSGGPVKGRDSHAFIRIIDFANAEINDHEGYDEGFVFGLETLRNMLVSTIDNQA